MARKAKKKTIRKSNDGRLKANREFKRVPAATKSVVNHPSHYKARIMIDPNNLTVGPDGETYLEVEVVDMIEAFAVNDAHVSQALKYVGRGGKKDGKYVENLAKAVWWLKRAIRFHGGHPEVD